MNMFKLFIYLFIFDTALAILRRRKAGANLSRLLEQGEVHLANQLQG